MESIGLLKPVVSATSVRLLQLQNRHLFAGLGCQLANGLLPVAARKSHLVPSHIPKWTKQGGRQELLRYAGRRMIRSSASFGRSEPAWTEFWTGGHRYLCGGWGCGDVETNARIAARPKPRGGWVVVQFENDMRKTEGRR